MSAAPEYRRMCGRRGSTAVLRRGNAFRGRRPEVCADRPRQAALSVWSAQPSDASQRPAQPKERRSCSLLGFPGFLGFLRSGPLSPKKGAGPVASATFGHTGAHGDAGDVRPVRESSAAAAVASAARMWMSDLDEGGDNDGPVMVMEKVMVRLEHQYTEANLSFQQLKVRSPSKVGIACSDGGFSPIRGMPGRECHIRVVGCIPYRPACFASPLPHLSPPPHDVQVRRTPSISFLTMYRRSSPLLSTSGVYTVACPPLHFLTVHRCLSPSPLLDCTPSPRPPPHST